MAGETNSANMNLPIPGVGVTQGPTWASDVNSCLSIIDAHDHSSGSGVQITPSGLNINSDLSFGSNNAISLKSTRFTSQNAVLAGASDLRCLYAVSADLYFNDGNGNNVRITQSGGVAGSPGSISNLTSPASAAYVSASSKFVWQSAANTSADMDGASVIIRRRVASSAGVTIAANASLSSDYTLTLPAALPASSSVVTLDNTGAVATTAINLVQSPSGSITMYGGTSAPAGWLLCDGSAVSRSVYSTLFGVVGTAFGSGDGATTFNLPDLRGRFIRGVDGTAGRDPDKASRTAMNSGGNTGNNVGSVQADQYASHTHSEYITSNGGAGSTWGVSGFTSTPGATIVAPTTNTGASGGNETRPLNAYLYFIIKT